MIVRRKLPRRFACEGLEERALFAIDDLAAISGLVFIDATGDGFTSGEEIAGAQVKLYRDDGDGSFDSGDSLAGTTISDTGGDYRFDHLTAGTYFVVQPPQTIGGDFLLQIVSSPIEFSDLDVQGVRGTVIDSFDETSHFAFAVGTQTSGFSGLAAPEAIGGARKLEVQLTGSGGGLQLSADVAANGPQVLDFHETGTGGIHRIEWDGTTQQTPSATGLGGVDLTDEGASTGLVLSIGGDATGDHVQIVITSSFQGAAIADVPIPHTGVRDASQLYPLEDVYVPFSAFSFSGSGADFSAVGSIRLTWVNDVGHTNGQIDSFSAIGPTLISHDFANLSSNSHPGNETGGGSTHGGSSEPLAVPIAIGVNLQQTIRPVVIVELARPIEPVSLLTTPALLPLAPPNTPAILPFLIAYGGSSKLPEYDALPTPRSGEPPPRLSFHELPEEHLQQVLISLAEFTVAEEDGVELADVQIVRSPVKVPKLPQDFLESPEEPRSESVAASHWYLATAAGITLASSVAVFMRPSLLERCLGSRSRALGQEFRQIGRKARNKLGSVFAHSRW